MENEPGENYYRKKYEMEVVEPQRRKQARILRNRHKMYRPIRR